jgi:hypothetical protein
MNSKRNVLIVQILILTVLCIIGCDNDNNNPNMNFTYPLAVGNSWQYDLIFTEENDSLAASSGLKDTVFFSTGLVEIITKEIIFDTLEVYNLATTLAEHGNEICSNQYYNNEDTGLMNYGYHGVSMITPKKDEDAVFISFDNKQFNNVREVFRYIERGIEIDYARGDSIYYDPVKCLEYPLEEGNQWVYRTSDNPWKVDKTIIGQESVEVPAGEFDCWKIHWTYPESDWDDNIFFYDYVSQEGLVKRFIELRNMESVDEDGDVIGYFNATEEKYLTDFHIND